VTDQSTGASSAAGSGRHLSPWAVLSIVTAVFFLCPLSTAIAPLLGLKALSEVRANPELRGRTLAKAGIVLGLVLTGAWIGAGFWWNASARQPMLNGPVEALRAGLAGDVAGFQAQLCCEAANADVTEAEQFLNALSQRYGRLLEIRQSPQAPAPDQPTGTGLRRRIPYLLMFERKAAPAVAEFVVFTEDEPGLQLKFSSIEVFDDDEGDLTYPPSLQRPEMGPETTSQSDSVEPSGSTP